MTEGTPGEQFATKVLNDLTAEIPLTYADCIEGGRDIDMKVRCKGAVEYRMPLSRSGKSFVRCDLHWSKHLDRMKEINWRYPDQEMPPADFDPTYAGEEW